MPSVLTILPEGFEEIEAVTPIDLLRRAGAKVTIASLTSQLEVTGRTSIRVKADAPLEQVISEACDCLFLPGGPGVKNLRSDPRVRKLVIDQDAAKRWIAAICAAPTVLLDAGVLPNRRHTAHFSVAQELPNLVANERVVVDGHIITSRGAGTALDFGLALVANLFSREKAAEISQSICV